MVTLKEQAAGYSTKLTRVVSELPYLDINSKLEDREATDKKGNPFKYQVVLVNGEEYRVPKGILRQLKKLIEIKPTLKSVRVVSDGKGMDTNYTVIPLE